MTTQRNLNLMLRMLLATLLFFIAVQGNAATTTPRSRQEIKQCVIQEARRAGLPAALALAVAKVGSDFQSRTMSRGGARGVMQLYPQTVEWVTADELWQPTINIRAGVRYLDRLVGRYFGRRELALSHYHSGYALDAPLLTTIEPGSESFVEQVLHWEERYREQSAVWREVPPVNDRLAGAHRQNTPSPWPAHEEQDDFGGDIEVRRIQARRQLDDFGYRWAPSRWRDER